ncbi:MAG: PDZ domain-containing protein [Deltaproteobacteria bacterium]|nr:PDZ domain-containing protein [Deltaproteobacteria bacterium]
MRQIKKNNQETSMRYRIVLPFLAAGILLAAVSAASFGLAHKPENAELFDAVVHTIERDYVDPQRINPRKMMQSSLEAIERAVPDVLVDLGKKGSNRIVVTVGVKKKEFSLQGLTSDVSSIGLNTDLFRKVFAFIQKWVDPEVDMKDVEYAAINGMLYTLDPHSVYLNRDQYKEMKINTSGNFGGLGIVITVRDGALTIISPIEGTPASRVGLKAKDKIMAINGESTINMPLTEAVQKLRGEPGTPVTIAVLRKGWNEPRDFTIVRAIIKIESVKSKLLKGDVGLVKITSFQGNTTRDLKRALTGFKLKAKHGLKGLVLDLRNNPGGLLRQAVYVSDLFLDRGVIVSRVGPGGRLSGKSIAKALGTEPKYPIVLLVNGGSASASEIVSGALKNHDRALVMGERTFGKGTVQVLYDARKQLFIDDDSALKLTVEKYLTPGGISIQRTGITPDVRVIAEYVDDKGIDLEPDTRRRREENLDEALGGGKSKSQHEKPTLVIRFLAPLEQKDDFPTSEQTKEAEVDFEVEAARTLIMQAKGWRGSSLLAQAPKILRPLLKAEKKKLEQALATAGLNWSLGRSREKAKLEATLHVGRAVNQDMESKKTKKPTRKPPTCRIEPGTDEKPLTAGETACMVVSVHNKGPGTVYRLHGISECIKCDQSPFDQQEFVLGKIKRGKTQSWSVPIKIPNSQLTGVQEIEVHFKEPYKRIPRPIRKEVVINALPRPFFAYSYRILDNAPGGNGDGLVEVGETVSLDLSLANEGEGKALKPLVLVENKVGNNIFLEKGRITVSKPILPGDSTKMRFLFQAKSMPKEDKDPLDLIVRDIELDEFMTGKLGFRIHRPVNARVQARNGWVTAIQDAELLSGASKQSPEIGILPKDKSARLIGEIGGFYKLSFNDENNQNFAFVRARDVRPAPSQSTADKFLPAPQRKPPRISLDEKGPIVVDSDNYTLKGRAFDNNAIKDVYIFNGNKKVFFSAMPKSTRSAPEIDFTADIALKDGDNLVTVIARESKDFLSRRFLIIRKRVKKPHASR